MHSTLSTVSLIGAFAIRHGSPFVFFFCRRRVFCGGFRPRSRRGTAFAMELRYLQEQYGISSFTDANFVLVDGIWKFVPFP